MKRTAVLILAAGESRRMGCPKVLLPWPDKPMVAAVVQTYLEAGLADIVVVTGCYRQEVEAALLGMPGRRVFNPDYPLGMASSVKAGVAALSDDLDFFLVAPADVPSVSVATISALLAAGQAHPDFDIFQPVCQGRRGHPLGLRGSLRREILTSPPGWTLRDLAGKQPQRCFTVPVDDPGILVDLDTPEDYTSLKGSSRRSDQP